jgi:hypothetical protein
MSSDFKFRLPWGGRALRKTWVGKCDPKVAIGAIKEGRLIDKHEFEWPHTVLQPSFEEGLRRWLKKLKADAYIAHCRGWLNDDDPKARPRRPKPGNGSAGRRQQTRFPVAEAADIVLDQRTFMFYFLALKSTIKKTGPASSSCTLARDANPGGLRGECR